MGKVIGFSNFLDTEVSYLKNEATTQRTYTFPDRGGVVVLEDYIPFVTFESIGVLAANTGAQNKAALQAAIDVVDTGVKRIFYGEGHYPLDGPIELKPGITIKGNSSGLKGPAFTSRFIITDTVQSIFKMQSFTTIEGWLFDYSNQPLTTLNPAANLIVYPATIVQSGALERSLTVKHCAIVGGGRFIQFLGATGCEDIVITHVYGYPLHGALINISKCFDIPYIDHCHVNPGIGRNYRAASATGLPCHTAVIDYVVANAAPTFRIDSTDEFVLSRLFAFGVKTGIQITNSYGSCVQCNMDIVETGFDIATNDARKAVQLIGCSGIASGGPTPANRNLVKFGGTGTPGCLIIIGLNAQLGVNPQVPTSANPNANSIVFNYGTGDHRLILIGITSDSAGTWTNDLNKSNVASIVLTSSCLVENATTKFFNSPYQRVSGHLSSNALTNTTSTGLQGQTQDWPIDQLRSSKTVSGNTYYPMRVNAHQQDGINHAIGQACWVNVQSTQADKRLVAESYFTNGSKDKGKKETKIHSGAALITVEELSTDVAAYSVPIKTPSYTVATVPSAATAGAGAMIFVSDESGGAVLAFSDATNWRRVTDRAIVS